MFAATLFDFNGVLVDDEAVHLAAFRATLAPRGIAVDERTYFERYIGFDDVGAFSAMLTDAGRDAPPALIAELVDAKRPLYLERARAGLTLFAGARERVCACAAHGPVGVVSGALRDEIELGLGLLGVRDRVSFIVAAEDTTRCKPDPEGYAKAIARLEVEPARVAVLEDSGSGIRAALGAGAGFVIGVGEGAMETGATLVVRDLRALTWTGDGLRVDPAGRLR